MAARAPSSSKIRLDHEVNVRFPQKDWEPDLITITGYEEKAHAAEAAIGLIVGDLESLAREELRIDPRARPHHRRPRKEHPRHHDRDLRWTCASSLRRREPDQVTNRRRRTPCSSAERLRNLEEEYMQDVAEREEMIDTCAAARATPATTITPASTTVTGPGCGERCSLAAASRRRSPGAAAAAHHRAQRGQRRGVPSFGDSNAAAAPVGHRAVRRPR